MLPIGSPRRIGGDGVLLGLPIAGHGVGMQEVGLEQVGVKSVVDDVTAFAFGTNHGG